MNERRRAPVCTFLSFWFPIDALPELRDTSQEQKAPSPFFYTLNVFCWSLKLLKADMLNTITSLVEQALLLKESGATLRELDITQVEKFASLVNAAKLDVDSLEALLTTDNTDLKSPAAKASAKTIMKLRKSWEKKERQKALSEARLSASSAATQPDLAKTKSSARLIVEQLTFTQGGLDGDQREDDGTIIPSQANID